jgi:tetratricopeptide (TPR) repeat protein
MSDSRVRRQLRRSAVLGLTLLLMAAPLAHAADTTTSKTAPDLASVKTKLKAKAFAAAIAELKSMLDTHQHADVYNLYAFSHRKSGDLTTAATFYAKALEFDPDHKGALEYQGEMFIQLEQVDKAKANLARLVALCPTGCEERADLEAAIAAAK